MNYKYKYDFEPIFESLTDFERKLSNLEQIRYIEGPEHFYKETAYYKKVDGKISYYYLYSNIKSRNYIRGSGYLTHGFDFYKGNFHGQMIRGLINFCNLKKGSVILDPFCGSGTTLIEAKLLGFNSIGIDINPIACLNSSIKTKLLDAPIKYLLDNNEKYFNLAYYKKYSPLKIKFQDFLKFDIKELFYTFLFTRAISDQVYVSKNRNRAFQDNFNNVIGVLKSFRQLKEEIEIDLGKISKIYFDDSLSILKKISSNSINAIITSPPYVNLIDYIENDKYQIASLLTLDHIKLLRKKSIGRDLTYQNLTEKVFWQEMKIFFDEIYRIVKRNSYFIIVVGAYRKMIENIYDISHKCNFKIDRVLERDVINLKSKRNFEYVFFLRKE